MHLCPRDYIFQRTLEGLSYWALMIEDWGLVAGFGIGDQFACCNLYWGMVRLNNTHSN